MIHYTPNFKPRAVLFPLFTVVLPALLISMSLAAPTKQVASSKGVRTPTYNADVRPILAESCFACHGPDSAARKAGLRLDRAQDAYAKRPGGTPVIPGDPLASRILERIRLPETNVLHMPPPAGHTSLSPAKIATITHWIASGAKYEQHWSYLPIKRPTLPKVKQQKWVRNAIDTFVLAAMEAKGLRPAPEADRRTLARRAAFDITGLPPSPKAVETFLLDKRPKAYETYVDTLLASPRWGEHRGRYWLDAARYADTHGIHFDNYREMWSYRNWVINAFNTNMPFDRFTTEQLAGDLLPNATLDQKVATGFTRCNITTNEGGAINEEYLVLYARDRTETAAQIWLGSTVGCAVCHDHKFDPIKAKDFYALSAFFNNTKQNAMDGNISDTPPIMFVPSVEDKLRFESNIDALASSRTVLKNYKEKVRGDFDAWFKKSGSKLAIESSSLAAQIVHLPLTVSGAQQPATVANTATSFPVTGQPEYGPGYVGGDAFVIKSGSSINLGQNGDFDGSKPFTIAAWVKTSSTASGSIIAKMDESADFRGWDLWLEGGKIGSHIIHKWPENALKSVTHEPLVPNVWHHVSVSYDGSKASKGLIVYVDGLKQAVDVQTDTLTGTVSTPVPLLVGQRSTGAGSVGTAVQDIRLFQEALPQTAVVGLALDQRLKKLLNTPQPSLVDTNELFNWWVTTVDTGHMELASRIAKLEDEERLLRSRGTIAHVASEKNTPAEAHILQRGEYTQRRERVTPDTPESLPPFPKGAPKNRLGLAIWLLMPENPLMTRVTVNRFWQEIYGIGLVRSSGDFGVTGELPSHPELLDWLATEFRAQKWDVKSFFKMMLMSATYRQSSVITPLKKGLDPSNKWLARGPRYRMDAEMIRDTALVVSGLLVGKIGGPSVKPYQPDGVWEAVAMPESNTKFYKRDTGENLYRRSIYTFWKRAAPPASMEIFNAPNRETCVVKRERTNTPLQALVTLNDVQFIESARILAAKLMQTNYSVHRRLDTLSQLVLSRHWKMNEELILSESLDTLLRYYKGHTKEANQLITFGDSRQSNGLPPADLAAWTMLCNQVLNLDEVLVK